MLVGVGEKLRRMPKSCLLRECMDGRVQKRVDTFHGTAAWCWCSGERGPWARLGSQLR